MRGVIVMGAAAVATVVAVAGCSSSAAPSAAGSSGPPSVAPTSAVPSTPAPPSPSPSPSPSFGQALGTSDTPPAQDGVTITLTVTAYQVITLSSENQELLPGGTRVALAKVKQCLTGNTSGDGIVMTWAPWTLLTASGETVKAISAYGTDDFPGPLYDNDASAIVPTGACRSGLVPFSLKSVSDPIVTVEYNANKIVEDWRVG